MAAVPVESEAGRLIRDIERCGWRDNAIAKRLQVSAPTLCRWKLGVGEPRWAQGRALEWLWAEVSTARALIERWTAEGVVLELVEGVVRASGDRRALERFLPMIRERAADIAEELKIRVVERSGT